MISGGNNVFKSLTLIWRSIFEWKEDVDKLRCTDGSDSSDDMWSLECGGGDTDVGGVNMNSDTHW